ncbi:MAG: metallopeptidase TldD-related protein [Chryseolinea sp.]
MNNQGLALLIITFGSIISPVAAQSDERVILKAMKDELKRSMEIRETGYDKPFYISYRIDDLKNYTVYASLGAIIQAGETKNRAKSVRVLVGDYEFNDESLDNNTFSEPSAREIQLPEEDDYYGIRRALWTTTDIVYKGAAQKFRKNQNSLKEQGKSLSDVPHRTFAKVPVIQKQDQPVALVLDEDAIRNYARRLSDVFRNFSELESSEVIISVTGSDNYFVNSEGTVVIKPDQLAVMQCRAQLRSKVGEPIFENLVYYAQTLNELPQLDRAIAEAKAMCDKLMKLRECESLEEEYSGPVLFLGPAVANLFSAALFSYRETLMASNAIQNTNDFRPDAAGQLDARLDKIVIDNSITIRALPFMKKFGNTSLLGAYEVDDEGVAPAAELMLIEKGVLKNLLNDRSLVKHGQKANGHSTGPGVLEITSAKQFTEKQLKQSLLTTAKNDGLPFALIVRNSGDVGEGLSEIWKVDISSGNETLVRSAQPNQVTLKDLRRISGTSATLQSVSVPAGEGTLASMICPAALLLESVDVTPLKLPYTEKDNTYVPSPLNN